MQGKEVATVRPQLAPVRPQGSSDFFFFYKYKALGLVLAINSFRENSDKIVREKARERDRRLEANRECGGVLSVLARTRP